MKTSILKSFEQSYFKKVAIQKGRGIVTDLDTWIEFPAPYLADGLYPIQPLTCFEDTEEIQAEKLTKGIVLKNTTIQVATEIDEVDHPAIPSIKEQGRLAIKEAKSEEFKKAIERTSKVVKDEDYRNYSKVRVEVDGFSQKATIVASDGYVLLEKVIEIDGYVVSDKEKNAFFLNPGTARILPKLIEKEDKIFIVYGETSNSKAGAYIAISKSNILGEERYRLWSFVKDSSYPDYKRVLEKEFKEMGIVTKENIKLLKKGLKQIKSYQMIVFDFDGRISVRLPKTIEENYITASVFKNALKLVEDKDYSLQVADVEDGSKLFWLDSQEEKVVFISAKHPQY